jgi:hypothetical protein
MQQRFPWLRRRLETICDDDVTVSHASIAALFHVLRALERGAPPNRTLPEPGILYSASGNRMELSWARVGLFIRPDHVVMFRPKPKEGEKWDFDLPSEADALARSTWLHL